MTAREPYPYLVKILQNEIKPGDQVLEVGCGAMQYKPYLPLCTYQGLDLPDSPYITPELDISGSAEDIPLDDEMMDLIYGIATFYSHSKPLKSFQECYRVLKPGGKLIAFEYRPTQLKRMKQHNPLYPNIRTWNLTELKTEFSECGFKHSQITDISGRLDYVGFPNPVQLLIRKIRRLFGLHASNWMIVLAEK